MDYSRNSVLELVHYEFINKDIINNIQYWIWDIQEYIQIKSTSYSIYDIYKLLLILILKSNKDFSNYIHKLSDDNIHKILIDIIEWKSKFLNKVNWHIELSDKNINNSILWWNSISLWKILKVFISTKLLNQSLEWNTFNMAYIENNQDRIEHDIWKWLFELLSVFKNVEKNEEKKGEE